jgi:peroxiredoxin Q/BCP
LRGFDVQYFAASVDAPDVNAKFAQSLGLDFPILSDPTKAVARAYGVLAASGFASRWTYYIGIDGRIAAIDRNVSAASHGVDIVKKLEELGIRRANSVSPPSNSD